MTLYSLKIKSNDTQYYRKSEQDWMSKTPVWMTKQELEEVYKKYPDWKTHSNVEVVTKFEPDLEVYKPAKRSIRLV